MKTASEEFIAAFVHSGSIVVDCACGITYFASYGNEGNFDEGELEELQGKRAANPEKYIDLDCSSVSYVKIGGDTLVVDCKCGKLARYEKFLWNWRDSIMVYFKSRIENEYKLVTLAHQKIHDLDRIYRKDQTKSLPTPKT